MDCFNKMMSSSQSRSLRWLSTSKRHSSLFNGTNNDGLLHVIFLMQPVVLIVCLRSSSFLAGRELMTIIKKLAPSCEPAWSQLGARYKGQ